MCEGKCNRGNREVSKMWEVNKMCEGKCNQGSRSHQDIVLPKQESTSVRLIRHTVMHAADMV